MIRPEFEEREEVRALRDELRYWRRQVRKARAKSEEILQRSIEIRQPCVIVSASMDKDGTETRKATGWYRVFVNGVYVDGHETDEAAERVADRLRKAFEISKPKREA